MIGLGGFDMYGEDSECSCMSAPCPHRRDTEHGSGCLCYECRGGEEAPHGRKCQCGECPGKRPVYRFECRRSEPSPEPRVRPQAHPFLEGTQYGTCEWCSAPMVMRERHYDGKRFLGCSAYRTCKKKRDETFDEERSYDDHGELAPCGNKF